MALKDRKITEAGIAQHGVISAPDRLTGTAAENKKVFDRLVRNVVAEQVNGLVDDLSAKTAGASGISQLGMTPIAGLNAANAQAALEELKNWLEQAIVGAGGVLSFNGRRGAVKPQSGDYTAAMVGAAPAGYGLGGMNADNMTKVFPDTIDSTTQAGWYVYYDPSYTNLVGLAFSGGLLVIPRFYGTVQIFFPRGADDNGHIHMYVGTYAIRVRNDEGIWSEWDIVNPPMLAGEEYRTTERYNGKPVYVQYINFGLMPNATTKTVAHKIQGITSVIDVYGNMSDVYLASGSYHDHITNVWADNTNVYVKTSIDLSSIYGAAVLKYVK